VRKDPRCQQAYLSILCYRGQVGRLPKHTSIILTIIGHTILHELTHLDSLATQAGLDAPDHGDDINRHGTVDVQTECELLGARGWLQTYIKDDTNPSPDYNAEGYAAAATGNSMT